MAAATGEQLVELQFASHATIVSEPGRTVPPARLAESVRLPGRWRACRGRRGEEEVTKRSFTVRVLPDRLAVCRLPAQAPMPDWAAKESLWSVTRTPNELSIVCPEADVPPGTQAERGWLPLHVVGPFPLTMTGVLASLTRPLANAGISIFAISTFETDIILVREADLEKAREALTRAGHKIQ